MKIKRLLGFVAIAVASVGILAACGKDAAKDQTVVRVGTMAKSESEQARWDKIEEILKKQGITLKFSEFTDYSQPNVALNNGDIDINAFQHYNFLDNWNSDHKTDLVPIAETYFTAFRVYSGTEGGKNKYKDIKELPEGATIAIPNDAVNESRALNLLQSAGLIKLSVGANDKAKLTDVSENSKNLNIREVDAIVHVVRCFEDENVVHVDGSIDPLRDIETINLELIFSDIEILDRRIAKTTKTARMDKEAAKELTSRYLAAMNGGSDTASQSAAEAITEEMVAAMTDSMPLRSLCSFGGFSRAEIQEMIDKLQAIYSNPLK